MTNDLHAKHSLQLVQDNRAGLALLFILGFGLLVYSLFAVLNGVRAREFPTRIPSGVAHRLDSLDENTPESIALSTSIKTALPQGIQ